MAYKYYGDCIHQSAWCRSNADWNRRSDKGKPRTAKEYEEDMIRALEEREKNAKVR